MLEGFKESYMSIIRCLSAGVKKYLTVELDELLLATEEELTDRRLDVEELGTGTISPDVVATLEMISSSRTAQLGCRFNYKKIKVRINILNLQSNTEQKKKKKVIYQGKLLSIATGLILFNHRIL